MRELKFRVWDKATKRYWNVAGLSFEKGRLVEIYLENYPTSFEGNEDCKKPDEVVLEQDTGLFDCNSQKIYEGDIVKYDVSSDTIGVVKYNAPDFVLDNELGELFLKGAPHQEVVGNIHENPELLEGEKCL